MHELRQKAIVAQTTLYLSIGSAPRSTRAVKRQRHICVTVSLMVLTRSKNLVMTLGMSPPGVHRHVQGLTLTSFDRDRVICVMTTGQAWQFRPYKWPEPRQLFHHGTCLSHQAFQPLFYGGFHFTVKGVYVSWSNDPPNTKIKDWNVSEMKVRVDAFSICQ